MPINVLKHDNRIIHDEPNRQDKPNNVSTFKEHPRVWSNVKVPTIDAGIATAGMPAARTLLRNKKITIMTRTNARPTAR